MELNIQPKRVPEVTDLGDISKWKKELVKNIWGRPVRWGGGRGRGTEGQRDRGREREGKGEEARERENGVMELRKFTEE